MSDSGDTRYDDHQLRVRRLFVDVVRKNRNVLAGQTWDLISPFNPNSLNTNGNYWFGGNATGPLSDPVPAP